MSDTFTSIRNDLVKLNTVLVEEQRKADEVKQFMSHPLFKKVIQEGFYDQLVKRAVFSDMDKEEREELLTSVRVLDMFLQNYGSLVDEIKKQITERKDYLEAHEETV